nr:hypothetical protein CFP56_69757 [Quercus suber]
MGCQQADTVTEFMASQPFIDSYAFYYGDRFEDCLKQVKSVYPHLDLSKVTIDNLLPSTSIGTPPLRRPMTPPSQSGIQKMMVLSLLNMPWHSRHSFNLIH